MYERLCVTYTFPRFITSSVCTSTISFSKIFLEINDDYKLQPVLFFVRLGWLFRNVGFLRHNFGIFNRRSIIQV